MKKYSTIEYEIYEKMKKLNRRGREK